MEFTDEFGDWWEHLTAEEQASVRAYVKLLEEYGVALRHPYCSSVEASRRNHIGSYGSSMPGDRIGCCMHSIPGAPRSS